MQKTENAVVAGEGNAPRAAIFKHKKSGNLYRATIGANGEIGWGYKLKSDGTTTGRLRHVDGGNYEQVMDAGNVQREVECSYCGSQLGSQSNPATDCKCRETREGNAPRNTLGDNQDAGRPLTTWQGIRKGDKVSAAPAPREVRTNIIDIEVQNEGSIFLFRPLNNEAEVFVRGSVSADAQWFGNALVVEHRYAAALAAEFQSLGFILQ